MDYKDFKKICDEKNAKWEKEGAVLSVKRDRPKFDLDGNMWSGVHQAYVNTKTGEVIKEEKQQKEGRE